MPRRLYIPAQVIEDISEHIESGVQKGIAGYWSANEDEDTLTGHLGACLKTGVRTVNVTQDEIPGPWKWSIDYTKFRGRGKNATESFLGADGIFELTLDRGFSKDTKSLLFQAKTDWDDSPDIVKQALLLSTWREASITVNYTESAIDAYSIDSVIASKGKKSKAKEPVSLQIALKEYFIICKIGNTDLRYDAQQRRLFWRDNNGVIVAVQFSIPSRIRVKVNSPVRKNIQHVDKVISPDEIHKHRMEVEPEEVLMPMLTNAQVETKAMQRSLAMAYHPDRFNTFDQLLKDIANSRMQEVNTASKSGGKRR